MALNDEGVNVMRAAVQCVGGVAQVWVFRRFWAYAIKRCE